MRGDWKDNPWARLLGAWGVSVLLLFQARTWLGADLALLAGVAGSIETIVREYGKSREGNANCGAWIVLTVVLTLILLPKPLRLTLAHFH